jgi:nicotinate-nucleotide adenylyltransferase
LKLETHNSKLCFFGGTFDPPHRGHILAARAAADRFSLDRVLLVPANIPPHKLATPITDYAHRLKMVEIAVKVAADSRLHASDIESPALTAGRTNYSLHTIQQLRKSMSSSDKLYFLLGADAFKGLSTWHQPMELAKLCEFIVVSRPHYDYVTALAALPVDLRNALTVHTIDTVMEDISATQVRDAVLQCNSLEGLVTDEVAVYIRTHGLYK